tara:strand:- start:168 stop:392 length:225 start_codon:yes stop_codon:yes gene_type:complete
LFAFKDPYAVGDLVIFLGSLEWDNTRAIEGEIGIVVEIFAPDDEINFFDLQVQLADGGAIPVWRGEVKKLEDAE